MAIPCTTGPTGPTPESFFDALDIPGAELDRAGRVLRLNRVARAAFPTARAEAPTLLECLDAKQFDAKQPDATAAGAAAADPERIELADGRVFQLRHARVDGRVFAWLVDVSAELAPVRALQAAQQRLRLLADSTPAMIWLAGADARRHWFNRTWLDFTGRSMAQESGDGWLDGVHPEDLARRREAFSACVAQRSAVSIDYRLRRHDGQYRWVLDSVAPHVAADGTPAGFIGSCIDIHERKDLERQLANTIPNLAWMANADGDIHWYNDRWYEYTGTKPAEMEGWGWQSVHDPELLPEVLDLFRRSLATGQGFEMTFPLRGADGVFRPFLTRMAPLLGPSGAIVQWFGTNTDVSALKDAEHRLREADRRKDEFLAMLAHELRNPLAPIRTAAELLKHRPTADPAIARASDIIERQALHMKALVDDLLDVSRVTRGLIELKRQRVDIAGVVLNAIEQVRPLIDARHHRVTLDDNGLRIAADADPVRLVQIFANLLTNAAKYTEPGGHIQLTIRAGADAVRVAVCDDGAGIEPELLARVFQPFSQRSQRLDRREGGLGLGLSIVQGLVNLHGGTVTADSDGPGRGSRFEVVLPRIADPAGAGPAAPADDAAPAEGTFDILLVDDNVDALETLAMLLGFCGHRTYTVTSGSAALAAAKDRRFDVAILDIGLPDMTGYELARAIGAQRQTPAPRLIALSGYALPEDRARSARAGFEHHMAKPVDADSLLDAIRGVAVSRHGVRGAPR